MQPFQPTFVSSSSSSSGCSGRSSDSGSGSSPTVSTTPPTSSAICPLSCPTISTCTPEKKNLISYDSFSGLILFFLNYDDSTGSLTSTLCISVCGVCCRENEEASQDRREERREDGQAEYKLPLNPQPQLLHFLCRTPEKKTGTNTHTQNAESKCFELPTCGLNSMLL